MATTLHSFMDIFNTKFEDGAASKDHYSNYPEGLCART